MSQHALRSAIRGLGSSIVLQLLTKVLSFGMRVVIARVLGPQLFAFSEVQLMLVIALVLLPAREGFRRISIRTTDSRQSALLATSGVILSIVLSLSTAFGHSVLVKSETTLPVAITCLGAAAESISEPFLVLATRKDRYAAIASARAAAQLFSSFGGVVVVYLAPQQLKVSSVAFSNVIFGVVLTVTMGFASEEPRKAFMLGKSDAEHLRLAWHSVLQSVIKFVFGNGENFVLLSLCNEISQGAYKLASNIAALAARFFFEPLEEQTFALFSKLQKDTRALNQTLNLALKASTLVAVVFAFLGPFYSAAFIRVIYGERWVSTGAPELLGANFIYLLFIAVNGTVEAYFNAVASSEDIKSYSKFSVAVMVLFIATASVLTWQSWPIGLVIANSLNMAMRALYCSRYIATFTSRTLKQSTGLASILKTALPSPSFVMELAVLGCLSYLSERTFITPEVLKTITYRPIMYHAVIGGISVSFALAGIWRFERKFLDDVRGLTRIEKAEHRE
mmetsp:Transcript_8552/g.25695  ORF Transcript_8552/g.25695 Transcript_8552/m.25695 type:complete len:507 (+) Transcript_8552:256-1776(+)